VIVLYIIYSRSSLHPWWKIQKPSYKESQVDDDDDDDDDDPMKVDDSDAASDSESDSADDVDGDDDDDEASVEPTTSMAQNRRQNNVSKSKQDAAASSSGRPSRAARFQGSMKEPPSESVRDLFLGTKIHQRIGGKAKRSDEDSDDEQQKEKDSRGSNSKSWRPPSTPPKSPARRHKHARKSVKDEASSDQDSEDDDQNDDDDQDELRIHRILASRTETRIRWREIGATMNSSEVTCGSVWNQPERQDASDDDMVEERFLIKWAGFSHVHVSWETQADLLEQIPNAKQYLSTFFRKSQNGILLSQDDRKDGDYFDPGYTQIDRILEVYFDGKHPSSWDEELKATNESFDIVLDTRDSERFEEGTGRQFLIKWEGMNYSDCTYEFERDLILADIDYKPRLKEYYERSKKPNSNAWRALNQNAERAMRESYKLFGDNAQTNRERREEAAKKYQEDLASHVFPNGGQLRDYQAEGVAWFLANYVNRRSCIMADEMGLVSCFTPLGAPCFCRPWNPTTSCVLSIPLLYRERPCRLLLSSTCWLPNCIAQVLFLSWYHFQRSPTGIENSSAGLA
jgi:Chromo (CHRromatin Organisation MOdifier) domain